MCVAWQTPKTNWVSTDFINYTDYERIRGNLSYLHDLAKTLYYGMPGLNAMTQKTSYSDYPYASEWNVLETNLHRIFNNIVTVRSIGSQMTFYDNGTTPTYEELNRIESATLNMYNTLTGQSSGRLTLSFVLNGGTIQP